MDEQEKKDRQKIIREGIDDFLDDHNIDLSAQNMERITKHLFNAFKDQRSVSATAINDHLSRVLEYNELNIESMDSEEGFSDEELLTSLILSAEKKPNNSAKAWLIALVIISLLVAGITYSQRATLDQQITVTQAEELKTLVAKVVEVEHSKNNKTSHVSVWNTVKSLEDVTDEGYKSSYTDFSQAQYVVAKDYLEDWLTKANKTPISNTKPHWISFTSTEIKVVDGDTFQVNNDRYRLWGIDAFEMKQQCFDQNNSLYACGINSKEALSDIFASAKDIHCQDINTGRHGRSVVKCKIDGTSLGSLLVSSGWVMDYEKYSGGAFSKAQDQAKASKAGAWDGCFVKPWDYRRKENLNVCEAK